MIGYVNPTLKVLLTIYIIWIALQTHWVPTGAPVSGLIAHAARGAVIVMLLSNTATFDQWVGTVFLQTIPDGLGNALNGSIGTGSEQSPRLTPTSRCLSSRAFAPLAEPTTPK
jgi:hypothetical protein